MLRSATLFAAIGAVLTLAVDLVNLTQQRLQFILREPMVLASQLAYMVFLLSLTTFFFALYAKQRAR